MSPELPDSQFLLGLLRDSIKSELRWRYEFSRTGSDQALVNIETESMNIGYYLEEAQDLDIPFFDVALTIVAAQNITFRGRKLYEIFSEGRLSIQECKAISTRLGLEGPDLGSRDWWNMID